MEIIAHRGASHDAPENTLSGIRLAWQQRADAIEVDVHFSRDGQLVVIHDANTRRTCGRNRRVHDQTLAELRELDAGCWKGPAWAGEQIPTLAEVLAALPAGKRLFIEIKCGSEFVAPFTKLLRRFPRVARRLVLISFSLPTVTLAKREFPKLQVCWIAEFKRAFPRRWTPSAHHLIHHTRAAGLDGLDLNARGPINAVFVEQVHAAGLKLYVWTVDSVAQARRLIAAGVDGITTNRPGRLREQLQAR